MISQLKVSGYKCLKEDDLPLSNLNILVGPNASGKSSVIQAILLLRQSSGANGIVPSLRLSGPLYEGGTAADIFHPEASYKLTICINKDENVFRFSQNRETDDGLESRMISGGEVNGKALLAPLFGTDFGYLNAERVGPSVTYTIAPSDSKLAGPIGKNGEFTTSFLARARKNMQITEWTESSKMAEKLIQLIQELGDSDIESNFSAANGRLDLVANALLGWIVPGASFEATEDAASDTSRLRYIRDPAFTKTSVRPTHSGFGLTYALPIITAALAIPEGGILVIENPEAHLHPFSQSRMGIFLAWVAASGRQVIVESHSDHVVNGMRLAVANGLLSHHLLRTYFFSALDKGTTARIKPIACDSQGRFDRWPVGFFDQIENDLSRL